jgi:hypothetical protein
MRTWSDCPCNGVRVFGVLTMLVCEVARFSSNCHNHIIDLVGQPHPRLDVKSEQREDQ